VHIESPETPSSHQKIVQLTDLLRNAGEFSWIIGQTRADIIADLTHHAGPPSEQSPPDRPFLLVKIAADGSLRLNNDPAPLGMAELRSRLRTYASGQPVELRVQADSHVRPEKYAELLDELKKAKISLFSASLNGDRDRARSLLIRISADGITHLEGTTVLGLPDLRRKLQAYAGWGPTTTVHLEVDQWLHFGQVGKFPKTRFVTPWLAELVNELQNANFPDIRLSLPEVEAPLLFADRSNLPSLGWMSEPGPVYSVTVRSVRARIESDGSIFMEGEASPIGLPELYARLEAFGGIDQMTGVLIQVAASPTADKEVHQLDKFLHDRDIAGLAVQYVIVAVKPMHVVTQAKSPG
jgi:biopolymer transport protein ExbD